MIGFNSNNWFDSEPILFVGLTDKFIEKYRDEVLFGHGKTKPFEHALLDADYQKIQHMWDWIIADGLDDKIIPIHSTLQEYIDTGGTRWGKVYIDGIFDKWRYGDNQYTFLFKMIEACLTTLSNQVTIRLNIDGGYNVHYLLANFLNTYSRVSMDKVSNNCYIFTFNKD